MTETTETPAGPTRGGLSSMLLPELKKVAGGLGIKSTGMKKADLIAAIKAAQSGHQGGHEGGNRQEPAQDKAGQDKAGQDGARQDSPQEDNQREDNQRGDNQRGEQAHEDERCVLHVLAVRG